MEQSELSKPLKPITDLSDSEEKEPKETTQFKQDIPAHNPNYIININPTSTTAYSLPALYYPVQTKDGLVMMPVSNVDPNILHRQGNFNPNLNFHWQQTSQDLGIMGLDGSLIKKWTDSFKVWLSNLNNVDRYLIFLNVMTVIVAVFILMNFEEFSRGRPGGVYGVLMNSFYLFALRYGAWALQKRNMDHFNTYLNFAWAILVINIHNIFAILILEKFCKAIVIEIIVLVMLKLNYVLVREGKKLLVAKVD
jgi:hypothetical protein